MWNDIRLAARQLAKHPSLTLAAVVALVLGMSATTTMFTIIHGVYLRDLPFPDPDRVVAISTRHVNGDPGAIDNWSVPDLQDLQASASMFDAIVAADEEAMDVADDQYAAERFTGAWVSPNVFVLTGHQPVLGRGFTPDDGQAGAAPVVVLGHAAWTRRYGGDPAVVGTHVRVNGIVSTVIGVMPAGYGFPTASALWQPISQRSGAGRDNRGNRNIDVFGRVAANATIEQAQADVERVMSRLAQEFPETNANVSAIVRPFRDLTASGPIRAVFAGLMGAGTFLLLIACANIANLLLARGAHRSREISVRMSLGATRRQIVRQLLTESLLLAIVAASAGLAMAAIGVRAFQIATADTGAPYWVQAPIEVGVVLFVAVICLGTTILCGLAPALQTSKVALANVLGDAGRGTVGSARARRWMDGFVIGQLALSLTLLAGAGLWMRTVYVLSRVDPGVNTSGLLAAQLSLTPQRYPDDQTRRAFYRQLGEQLAALPGMQAGVASATPLGGATFRRVSVDSRRSAGDLSVVSTVAAGPGYFEALGMSAHRGRLFTAADVGRNASVAVVNEQFAARHFPGIEIVGRTIRLEPMNAGAAPAGTQAAPAETVTIVGVVANVRQTLRPRSVGTSSTESVVYLTYDARPLPSASILVRSSTDPAVVAGALRNALRAVDPDLPLTGSVVPLSEARNQELGLLAVFASMMGLFAAAAMSLAMVGVYGVTAYAVSQRTRELGVRVALGAGARRVCWEITRRATFQLIVGLSLGLAGGVGVGRLMQGAVPGVNGGHLATLLVVGVLMASLGAVACLIPAARAVRLDPTAALRVE
jgi:predicted permease